MTGMKRIFLIITAIIFFASLTSADVYLKTRMQIDPVNTPQGYLPAREINAEQWISDDFYLNKAELGFGYLFDLKKNIFYILIPHTRSFLELTPPADFTSLLPPEMDQMSRALSEMTISVRPTGETRMVQNVECQGYRLETTMMMFATEMTIWASEKPPVKLKKFLEYVWPQIMKMQLRASGPATSELDKIKGLWMAYETRMRFMGIELFSRAEVVEITTRTAPKGIYAIPENYRKKDRLEIADLQFF